MYSVFAEAVLVGHAGFILWVVFGARFTRARPWLAAFHISSLVYGIVAEVGPWPCPLTLAENFFEARDGVAPYQGPFLLHYLDAIIYPNLSATLLTVCGVAVCVMNLLIYGWRLYKYRTKGNET